MIRFYFDVNLPRALLEAARVRRLDVLTSQEDGTRTKDDLSLLKRATSLNRVLVTQDNDFKGIVANALRTGEEFTGVIFINAGSELGVVAEHLELVAKAERPTKFKEGIYYIPLS